MTKSGNFACLPIHLHEIVPHHSPKCHSKGLSLRRLGPAFPDKSLLEPHNSEYSEPERSGSCTGGSEDRCEEFFARTRVLFQEWFACCTADRCGLLSNASNPLNVLWSSHSFLTATSFFRC